MKILILLILFTNLPLWAQTEDLEVERKALAEQKKKNEEWEKSTIKRYEDSVATLKKNNELLADLELVEKNRKANSERVMNEINAKIAEGDQKVADKQKEVDAANQTIAQ